MIKYIIFLILVSLKVIGQVSVSQNAVANIRINSYLSLDINSLGMSDFKFKSTQELLDGIILPNRLDVKITSNKNWILNASSLTSNFLSIGPNSNTQMPASVIGLKKNGTQSFINLSNNPSLICSGLNGTFSNLTNSFKLDLKATPGYDFEGGQYALVILFTLSSQ